MLDALVDKSLEGFFSSFPAIAPMSRSTDDVVAAILDEAVASRRIRSGSNPLPENLAIMRKIIALYVQNEKPIPFIIPWGPKKPTHDVGIDLAEYAGLKTIENLNSRVQSHYLPGIQARIRVEDICGYYLLQDDGQVAIDAINRYSAQFEQLIDVMGLPFVHSVRETSLVDFDQYMDVANSLVPNFLEYLTLTDADGTGEYQTLASWQALSNAGWKSGIPYEQREYYRSRYRVVYPGRVEEEYTRMLAQYFAYCLARVILCTYGVDEEWGSNFLQVNFTTPVPGSPPCADFRKVYYRTAAWTEDRTPPWKAKGYFRIIEEKAIPTIGSWHSQHNFQPHFTELQSSDGSKSVTIQTDYLLS